MLGKAMAVSVALALALSAAPAPAAPPERIVGGAEVGDDVRFGAALLWTGVDRVRCTASVIGAGWLLTARHCLPGVVPGAAGTWPIIARVGHPEHARGEVIVVEKAVELAKKGDGRTVGDLALLKLTRPITDPSPVPLADAVPTAGPGAVYGYGYVCAEPDCPLAARLKTATVNYVGPHGYDYEGNAGALAVSKGNGHPTNGDSGGPLFLGGKVVGVASQGKNPAMYSPVPPHRAWIRSTTGI
ncbi:trypsin [Pilimelia terevasa]|uniref:Trypsin n=1 Tax=Pilimelia terevasa TaxID=53372 RepID=A0A8J3BHK2_9ACTN|nr:trypsin-like serine protease [Pilimelia terevasa]GGK22109.1 trypsin [Pilimelia terevasa]